MYILPHFYYVRPLFRKGFGYGDDTKPQFKDQVTTAGQDFVTAAENLLLAGHALVHVGHLENGKFVEDDGCGDGRPVWAVQEGPVARKFSLHRPKVFGGGVMMATAMRIGLGQAVGEQLVDSFAGAMTTLDKAGMDYGAHTDSHATGINSGCAAIDNAPLVLRAIQLHRQQIERSIIDAKLGASGQNVQAVMDNFLNYCTPTHDQGYEGKKIVHNIAQHGKVVKHLNGEHRELFVLLNDVASMTASQSMIRDATGGKVQLYCVDVWRMREIAKALHADVDFERAFLSELVYTFGVMATLTPGDLPVFYAALREDSRPHKRLTAGTS